MKKLLLLALTLTMAFSLTACENSGSAESELQAESGNEPQTESGSAVQPESGNEPRGESGSAPEGFVLIEGGSFQMGSPDSEAWRSEDERQHFVTVSDFYMSAYEVTQQEYQDVMGDNPIQYGKLHQRGGI